MDVGAWWATVHGVAKSRTQLSNLTFWVISKKVFNLPQPQFLQL